MRQTQTGKTLAHGVAAAALLCAASWISAGAIRQNRPSDYGQFEKKLSKDQAILHALDRLTFGPKPGDVAAVKKMGLEAWIDLQLHPEKIPENPELEKQVQALAQNSKQGKQAAPAQYAQEKIYRAVYSNRQLQEVLVDFWFNHFNVDMSKGADRNLTPAYEREAIRPNVLGKFRDLLEATATSPAMLFYLDNWQSVAPDTPRRAAAKKQTRGLNENYARELMELHTLGVDGGYTQKDVTEVARCFTGWTIDRPNQAGTFLYNDRTHDKGEKIVLGVTIPAGGGKEDGEKVLDILAHHRSTARFISKKLAQRFVADDPPPALIDRMAQAFQDSDGDIRAVLTVMFGSKEFFSQGAFRAKVRTPLETVVGAVRATGARVDSAAAMVNQIGNLGEPLYRKIEPTGYSNLNGEWVNSSALLARMNFAMQLGENRLSGVHVDAALFSKNPSDAARQVLFTNASSQTLEAIRKELSAEKRKNPRQQPNGALIAGLLIGSPDFQRK
ncbi:MAG TPA: DUF1800 domain-containing protein [Bryobacteraceae bacterium]|nr:DUF1800 domain-containing protein [Bryobacteraceae bacterium]